MIGTSTVPSVKLSIPWDGATTPKSGITRQGIDFVRAGPWSMATQPISEAGAVYSRSGYVGEPASRLVSVAGGYEVSGLLALGPLRSISPAAAVLDRGGFERVGADRAMSAIALSYVSGGLISLLNLRVLSQPLSDYAPTRMLRASATRPISPGYLPLVVGEPAAPADATPPAVGNFSPTPGTPISRTTPASFDVTDESGVFRRFFVVAFLPATGVTELVHDGDAFRGFYAATSSRTMIGGGFRFTVLRSGGWPGAPTIQAFAIDHAGNEAN